MSAVPEDSDKLIVKHSSSASLTLSSIIVIEIHCLVEVDISSTVPDCARKSSGAVLRKNCSSVCFKKEWQSVYLQQYFGR